MHSSLLLLWTKMGNDAPRLFWQIFTISYRNSSYICVCNRYGRGLCYKAVSSFIGSLNSFIESNKNYKDMQKDVLGISVVKSGPHIMQYKKN